MAHYHTQPLDAGCKPVFTSHDRNGRMKKMCAATFSVLLAATPALATETENLDLQVLPAPGTVAVDGQIADWDLSAGIFSCGDVEKQRDQYATWFYAMYDKENLYLLARWTDRTPMNNP